MVRIAAQSLVALGVLHVIFGLFRFKAPLREVVSEGFFDRFKMNDTRRLAFWFILVGPLLMLIGQLAVRAVRIGETGMVLTIGLYLFAGAVIGVLAAPKSPLWALFPPAAVFIAAGFGYPIGEPRQACVMVGAVRWA